MADQAYQIAVIGGGINGAGIAREAAYRGYRTLLVEQGDFAQATSSQSSKLIHGGIRYLEQGRLGLVFEALHERAHLLRIAPHLVHPLRLHIPVYQGDARPPWMIGIGCWLYDLLAGSRNLEPSRRVPPSEWEQLGGLQREGLKAVFAYSDAQVFDARLTLETALSAAQAGADIFNYTSLEAAQNQGDGWLLELKDQRNGQSRQIQAQVVVNAAGAWAPQLDSWFTQKKKRPGLRFSRGIHLVFDGPATPQPAYLTLPEGGRVVFVLPWMGKTLVGTTESDFTDPPTAKVPPSEEEINYLLKVYGHYFPQLKPQREQVRYIHSGLRSLIDRGERDLGKMSREAQFEGEQLPGGAAYWLVLGGKITTYRSLGRKLLDQLGRWNPSDRRAHLDTAVEPLPGAEPLDQTRLSKARADLAQAGLGPAQEARWVAAYGTRWVQVARYLRYRDTNEDLTGQGFLRAELRYLVQQEMAWTLDDITQRRTLMAYDLKPEQIRILSRALTEERRWKP
ncbi:MAG: glycerol-3-phosphate dehydrogenase [bacterium]|nr:glycerol-3-phosphate dehydrogenase [bacterium]